MHNRRMLVYGMSSERCAAGHREPAFDHSPSRCEQMRVSGQRRAVEEKRKGSNLAGRRVILGEQVKGRERMRSERVRERLPLRNLTVTTLGAKAALERDAGHTVNPHSRASCFGSRTGVVSSWSRTGKVVVCFVVCQSSIRGVVPPSVLFRSCQGSRQRVTRTTPGPGGSGSFREVFGKRSGGGRTSGDRKVGEGGDFDAVEGPEQGRGAVIANGIGAHAERPV